MHISVIIPCYNEEQRIGATLTRIGTYLLTQPYEHEIIIVDNGSSDKTVTVAEEYIKTFPKLRIISHEEYGKGWAVKQGMLAAKGDYRLFTDADNSTDIAHLEVLLPFTKQGYDVVVSSRKIKGARLSHPQPPSRVFLGNMFALLVSIIVPTGVKDTQNGFKLFSAKAAEELFSIQKIYYWAFDVEILALAQRFNFKVKEVPITWINDDRSTMNFKGMVNMLIEVLRIRWNLLFLSRGYNE